MTPAVLAARKAGIRFALHRYEHDAGAEAFGSEAAEKLNQPPARVLKTLIASAPLGGRRTPVVAVVPVAAMLDLKLLAAALGAKTAGMADPSEAQRLTGYLVGGISPLGQKRMLATVIDDSVSAYETVFVSAGRRGLEIELAPDDLRRLTNGVFAPIASR